MAKVFRTLSDVHNEIRSEALSQQPLLTDDYTYDTVNERRKDIEDGFNDVNETLDEMSDTNESAPSGEYVAPAEDLPVIIEPENDLLTGKPKKDANQTADNEVPIGHTSGNEQDKNEKENAVYNDLQDEFLVDEIIIVQEIPDEQEDLPDNLLDKDNSTQCGCKKQG